MPKDDRLNLDAADDIEVVKSSLLKDVAEATEAIKQRKAEDKVRDARLRTQARDRTAMWLIVVAAAVILFGLAYWMTFVRGSVPQPQPRQLPPRPPAPMQIYRTPQPYVRPRPSPPPSEPVRRTPTDTYDEGPETGSM